ncbi:hypothetical protein [Paenibacillus roseipurpureus]|uniref:hypothetical protein n=1 Tax=Paenibacillus roseopurpureus TaxID=2918901 RepID=UPI0028EC9280|nr:hypothetical protein [Paenibacillus sp. MBLB1832]
MNIVEGEVEHPPPHPREKGITVQSVDELLSIHLFDVTLESVTLDSKSSVWRQVGEVKKLRFAIPVVDLILGMQVVQTPE